MEYQVLAEFVRLLKISRNSRIEAPLLQYLSIMIQNMDSEHAICKMLSSKIHLLNSECSHSFISLPMCLCKCLLLGLQRRGFWRV